MRTIRTFLAKEFVCEDCGRRNYYSLIHRDPKTLNPELKRTLQHQQQEVEELVGQEACQAMAWVIEPSQVRCSCGATYQPVDE